jgi:hypothetical protein
MGVVSGREKSGDFALPENAILLSSRWAKFRRIFKGFQTATGAPLFLCLLTTKTPAKIRTAERIITISI